MIVVVVVIVRGVGVMQRLVDILSMSTFQPLCELRFSCGLFVIYEKTSVAAIMTVTCSTESDLQLHLS